MSDPGRPLRVVLVGDDPLARGGIERLLEGEPDIQVVASVATGAAAEGWDLESSGASSAVPAGTPFPGPADVAVWDVGPDAAAWLDQLGEPEPGAPPALALVRDDEAIAAVVAAGAQGCLYRDAEAPRLAAALRALAAGLAVFDAAMERRRPRTAGFTGEPPEPLTPRELEVLQLLAAGLSNRRIAESLGISEHTAKFHVTAIVAKLGAQTRTDAAIRAARLGLVPL